MTDREKTTSQAEELVRKILSKSFNQEVDPETIHTVAEKVSRVIPESTPKKAA